MRNLCGGDQSIHLCHGNVHEHNVGRRRFDEVERLASVTGFANDFGARHLLEERSQASAHEQMIINE
jgi:hypothetical protein